MAGVITASEPSWIAPFTGLSPRHFRKVVTLLRREGADTPRRGHPWSLPLEERVRAELSRCCGRRTVTPSFVSSSHRTWSSSSVSLRTRSG
uniref:Orf3 n=1 Tax=Streptomyces netropsis TaxID=55404 RepID=P72439_STRNE|nr:orf3 [Streptomyces netropsis]